MSSLRLLPLALALGVVLSACTPSSQTDEKSATKSPDEQLKAAQVLVDGASKKQAKAERVFDGLGGMVGVVIAPTSGENQEQGVVWMSPDGTTLFPGPALDASGENINPKVAQQQLGGGAKAPGQADASTVDKGALLERAASSETGSFVQGKSGPVVTAIVDLNCSHCNTFFASAQPLINSGKLRVRYVLAGFMSATSAPKAAAVLGAKDKIAAMKKAEADFAKNGAQGPAPKFEPKFEAIAKANTELLMATGEPATPYLFYCDKETKTLVGMSGAPQDMPAFVASLDSTSHPYCGK